MIILRWLLLEDILINFYCLQFALLGLLAITFAVAIANPAAGPSPAARANPAVVASYAGYPYAYSAYGAYPYYSGVYYWKWIRHLPTSPPVMICCFK